VKPGTSHVPFGDTASNSTCAAGVDTAISVLDSLELGDATAGQYLRAIKAVRKELARNDRTIKLTTTGLSALSSADTLGSSLLSGMVPGPFYRGDPVRETPNTVLSTTTRSPHDFRRGSSPTLPRLGDRSSHTWEGGGGSLYPSRSALLHDQALHPQERDSLSSELFGDTSDTCFSPTAADIDDECLFSLSRNSTSGSSGTDTQSTNEFIDPSFDLIWPSLGMCLQ
jgi:hypothetical protein